MPDNARPHEVAILRIYLSETFDPQEIASILHYKTPHPVYKVIRNHRDFLSRQRVALYSGTIHVVL